MLGGWRRCALSMIASESSGKQAACSCASVSLTNVMRYPQLLRCGPNRKCLSKLQTMYRPFTSRNCANASHVESVQRSGDADDGGAERCGTLGSKREPAGKGEGERSGCDDVYDFNRCARRPAVGDPGSAWRVAMLRVNE